MSGYRLSRLAEADLDEIWDYTAETWSVDRADRYISEIRLALESLSQGHHVGRSAEEIGAGYRKIAVNSHFAFFRIESGTIMVVRILHERMDFRSHFSN